MTKHIPQISVQQAWQILSSDPIAQLVDVRTNSEWEQVGVPNLTSLNKETLKISWRSLPDMAINDKFISNLQTKISSQQTPLLFLCRSGGRSNEAASVMAQYGYNQCYNVEGGFEGCRFQDGSEIKGWRAENLPWEQQ